MSKSNNTHIDRRNSAAIMMYVGMLFLVPPSQPIVTSMGPAIENREGTSVAKCRSTGFKPMAVNVTWTSQGDHDGPDVKPTVTDMGNYTFTLVSHYTRALNRSHNGQSLTCSVSHMALTQPVSGSVTLTVLCT